MLLLLLTALPPYRLTAQCPDGAPPPCRTAAVPAARVDPDAVAILPFRIVGPPETQYLREGMVDLLNVGLDGFARWRVLQPRGFLRMVTGVDRVETAEAARLARQAGAGSFVVGSITAAGAELVGQAALHESARGTLLTSVRVRGAASAPAALADSIAAGLARYRASREPGITRRPMSDYTTASPQALLSFLAAEQLARRGRWAEAIDSLTSAIHRDSTFALAYYQLTRAIAWGALSSIVRVSWDSTPATLSVDQVFAAARRHRERAPLRQRRLIEALALTNRIEQLRAMDALVRAYPDDADVALEAADAFFHMALPEGQSPALALQQLERAVALDAAVPETYLHVIEVQSMLGDSAGAWRTLQRLRAVSPGWNATDALELGLRALRGEDPAALPAANADLLNRAGRYTLWSGDGTPARAIAIADAFAARRGAAGPATDRVPALLQRHVFAIAQGRRAGAWGFLREASALDPEGGEVLGQTVFHHLVTGSHADEAEDAARRLLARPGARPLWASVLLAWRVATLAPIDSARAALPGLLDGPDWPLYRASQLAGLGGLLDLRRGDSAAARRGLARGNSEWIEARGFEALVPGPLFGLLAARLDAAAGDLDAATGHLAETIGTIGPHFRAEAEELRARIAERRGDTVAALRAYRNFVALWAEADPTLQPRVASARAALMRLEN